MWASTNASIFDDDVVDDTPTLESKVYKTKDAVFMLVDCSAAMFQTNSLGEVPFLNVMKLIENTVKEKIISNRTDKFGIVFYNTRETKNSSETPNVVLFQELDEPSAQMVTALAKFQDLDYFQQTIGSCTSADTLDLGYVFLAVVQRFLDIAAAKNWFRRIFLFTNEDDPHQGNAELNKRARRRVDDMEANGVSLLLFPTPLDSTPGKTVNFDMNAFWGATLHLDTDETTGRYKEDFSSHFDKLKETLRKKSSKKRALASVNWKLSEGSSIAIQMYVMNRTATKESKIFLHYETQSRLVPLSKNLCLDTGAVLTDMDILKYQLYGDRKVYFSKEDMRTVKFVDSPGLTLIGFKPTSELQAYHNLKNPYFIFPNDKAIKGSTTLFHALLKSMHKLGKMAICRLIYRERSNPYFVAVLPQPEELDVAGRQLTPPGMHMIFLPYADDIRNPPVPTSAIADEAMVLQAKKVVKSLTVFGKGKKFENDSFKNPSLQLHYNVLQALALDEDLPETVEDTTLPDVAGIAEFNDVLEAFNNAVGLSNLAPAVGNKRKRPNKKYVGPVDSADIDFKILAGTGTLGSLTMNQLKEFMTSVGLKKSGKKALLIERIEDHFAAMK